MGLTRQSVIAFAIVSGCARAPDGTARLSSLAARIGATRRRAAEVANLLVGSGLLQSGAEEEEDMVRLAVDPKEATLGAVLRVTEVPLQTPVRGAGAQSPAFRMLREAAAAHLIQLADAYTIEDLLTTSGRPPRGLDGADLHLK